MSEDAKLDFYLKHRVQIEQWADLRAHAQKVLDVALITALERLADDGETPAPQIPDKGDRNVKLRIPGAESEPTWVELNWAPNSLLRASGGGTWPALIVAGSPDAQFKKVREQIKQDTRPFRAKLGLDEGGGNGWWIWYGRLRPESEPIELERYADYCAHRFRDAWIQLHEVMRASIEEVKATTDGHGHR